MTVNLDGSLPARPTVPFTHLLSNHLRDLFHTVVPAITERAAPLSSPRPNCQSFIQALPLISPSEGEMCPICEVEYQLDDRVVQLGCGHGYHLECISTWGAEVDLVVVFVVA